MRNRLQQFTSAFPGGWPGVGLLLLRAEIGVTSIIQGGAYLSQDNTTFGVWTIGAFAILGGLALLIGFLTPVACLIVGLAAIFIAFSSIPTPTPNLLNAMVPTVLVVVVAIAVVLLGPGALSLDARRFGRREIIIPRTPPSPQS